MKKRYTYSLNNSSRFFPIYDRMVEYGRNMAQAADIEISPSKLGMSPLTLQNRLRDGLKYLYEKWDEIPWDEVESSLRPKYTRADYGHLRLSMKIRLTDHGTVLITFNVRETMAVIATINRDSPIIVKESGAKVAGETSLEDQLVVTDFRQTIINWLATPEPVKRFKNLKPSDADRRWFQGIMANSPHIESYWDPATGDLNIVKITA